MRRVSIREYLELLCAPAGDPRPTPVTAVIVAHPDDEVIGAGGILPRLRNAAFIHVTDGAPLDGRDAAAGGFATRCDYAAARRRELHAALSLVGILPAQTCELKCTDQQASVHLVELSRQIANLIWELDPDVILTHPYEGGHPDHDATAFAVHAACRSLRERGVQPPEMIEMTSYHLGPTGIEPCTFLPSDVCEVATVMLSEAQRELKRRLFDCYRTQKETLKYFPIAIERFRPAPRYDFAQPPHPGTLFYELHPWGMTGKRFRQLVMEAVDQLRIGGAL